MKREKTSVVSRRRRMPRTGTKTSKQIESSKNNSRNPTGQIIKPAKGRTRTSTGAMAAAKGRASTMVAVRKNELNVQPYNNGTYAELNVEPVDNGVPYADIGMEERPSLTSEEYVTYTTLENSNKDANEDPNEGVVYAEIETKGQESQGEKGNVTYTEVNTSQKTSKKGKKTPIKLRSNPPSKSKPQVESVVKGYAAKAAGEREAAKRAEEKKFTRGRRGALKKPTLPLKEWEKLEQGHSKAGGYRKKSRKNRRSKKNKRSRK